MLAWRPLAGLIRNLSALQGCPHHTGKTQQDISRDIERDFFLSPPQAVDYGIIDTVITNRQLAPTEAAALDPGTSRSSSGWSETATVGASGLDPWRPRELPGRERRPDPLPRPRLYLYAASIIFLVGIQIDELLRKDTSPHETRIIDLLRLGFGTAR